MAKEIKIYTLKRQIGKYWYTEQICATSEKQAKKLAQKLGAKLDGFLIEQLEYCERCGAEKSQTGETLVQIGREIGWIDKFNDDH